MTHTLEIGATYVVANWQEQIAVRFVSYGLIEVDDCDCWALSCCEDEENQEMCDHSSDMCWVYSEPELEPDYSRAIVVMVGDDRRYTVDTSDLIPVDREGVCSCGDLACKWY